MTTFYSLIIDHLEWHGCLKGAGSTPLVLVQHKIQKICKYPPSWLIVTVKVQNAWLLAASVKVYVTGVWVLAAKKSPEVWVDVVVKAPELSVATGSFQLMVVPLLWKGTETTMLSGQSVTTGDVLSPK